MVISTYILFVLGILGATDIALFHSTAHGLRSHPDSKQELVTHALRGPTYAALFLLVPNFAMHGACFWVLMGIFAFDLLISVWDFSLEGESRRFLGGLPAGEYVLHILLAMCFGALVASACFEGADRSAMASRFEYAPAAVPWDFRLIMAVMAALVLASGIGDAVAAIRMRHREPRWQSHTGRGDPDHVLTERG